MKNYEYKFNQQCVKVAAVAVGKWEHSTSRNLNEQG